MNKTIAEALKDDETPDVSISNEERLMLIDILYMIAATLENGKLWFNKPGIKNNQQYIDFCKMMAKKFANMEVHQEQ